MIDSRLIEQIANAVLAELSPRAEVLSAAPYANASSGQAVRDITSEESRAEILIEAPCDPDALVRMKKRTNARIGVGRAGCRYNTQTLITLRADHAAARDAVMTDINQKVLDDLKLFTVESRCGSKNEFLTRPDLGRLLSDQSEIMIREKCAPNPDIQIFAADGLSSTAITANLPDLMPSLLIGLKNKNVSIGTPFFVRNGRVGIMEPVAEILGAKVTCVLIGERPGLATAESMSSYIAYDAKTGMDESKRTVVSNIHRRGIPAVEAGAYLADLLCKILRAKASGVDLRKEG
ncbi:MAG: ethanolamine ammonia-lyase subunit EutC [Synergistaceae bacterium]|jgi:ethanolamine ammonia-lyase small subunit|nr:ethanolamine ammonia-lyase subunit EutC [Synergistaceae bacterium]